MPATAGNGDDRGRYLAVEDNGGVPLNATEHSNMTVPKSRVHSSVVMQVTPRSRRKMHGKTLDWCFFHAFSVAPGLDLHRRNCHVKPKKGDLAKGL